MLGTQDLALFIASGLLLNVTPGPDTLYIIGRSTTQRFRGGATAALGIGAGILVHIAAAALGLSAILAVSSAAFTAVKLIGAAYLVYVGISLIRFAGATSDSPNAAGPPPALLRTVFIQGFLTNVLNPKVALFFLAFLPQFVDPGRGPVAQQILLLGLLYVALALVTDSSYALLAGSLRHRLPDRALQGPLPRYISGSVYLGLGVTTVLTGRKL
jgi:threonine/homoserine/homoserine lactone efflux protein